MVANNNPRRAPRINAEKDYIRVGNCRRCKRDETSVVIHHPENKRPYSVCNYCNHDMWIAVGEANKANYLKFGSPTVPRKRERHTRDSRN